MYRSLILNNYLIIGIKYIGNIHNITKIIFNSIKATMNFVNIVIRNFFECAGI